jgi:hypothetical protein
MKQVGWYSLSLSFSIVALSLQLKWITFAFNIQDIIDKEVCPVLVDMSIIK